MYNQGRFEESANNYQQSIDKLNPSGQKANAYYNLGNALFQKEILRAALMPINKRLELNQEIRKRSTIYPLH